MIKKKCTQAGCNNFCFEKSKSYCLKHYSEVCKKRKEAFKNAVRENERLYNTHKWRKIREAHLKYNNQCCICGSENYLTVDHITPPKGNEEMFFNPDNLQTLCKKCHLRKTISEVKK